MRARSRVATPTCAVVSDFSGCLRLGAADLSGPRACRPRPFAYRSRTAETALMGKTKINPTITHIKQLARHGLPSYATRTFGRPGHALRTLARRERPRLPLPIVRL